MTIKDKIKILLSLAGRSRQTKASFAPVNFRTFFLQYILGFNKTSYWPVHFTSVVTGAEFIRIGTGTAPGLSHGCYIFAAEGSEITIGDYTLIAPNVCIAGFNHDMYNSKVYEDGGRTSIGKYCWIGMNACILPGIKLGDHTIVAAGAVVTHSFEEGYNVLGGNPARIIKSLAKEKCVEHVDPNEYVGYFTKKEFLNLQSRLLKIKNL